MLALDSHQREGEELAQAALSALQATTGLNGRLVPLPIHVGRGGYRPNVAVELNVENKNCILSKSRGGGRYTEATESGPDGACVCWMRWI